jgi:hypothetical protein
MWAQLPYLMGSIIEKDTSSAAGAASIGQLLHIMFVNLTNNKLEEIEVINCPPWRR